MFVAENVVYSSSMCLIDALINEMAKYPNDNSPVLYIQENALYYATSVCLIHKN